MATKNFTQFSTATPLTTSDYIVGYNAAGTAELKTTVKQIVDLVGETDSQTLSFNEATKDLSITSGNTVSLSALIDSNIDTGVRSLTSNWQETFTVVQVNSASWEESQDITAITTTVASNSSNWNDAYNIGTAYQIISSTFLTSETDSQTLSFNNTTKELSISSGNTVSLSALTDIDNQSVNSLVQTASGNWNDAFNTGTVYKANSGDYISLDENNSLSARFIPYSGTVQEIDSYVGIEGEIVSDKATIRLMDGLNPGGIKMLTENDSSGTTSSEGGTLPLNAANTLFVSSRQPSQAITLRLTLLGTGNTHFLACQLWDGTVQVLSSTPIGSISTFDTSFTVPLTGAFRGAAVKNILFWPCLSGNDTIYNPSVNFRSINTHTNSQLQIENISSYGLQSIDDIGKFSNFIYTGNILDLRKTSVKSLRLANCSNLYEIFGLNERKSTLEEIYLGKTVFDGTSIPAANFQQTKFFENVTSFTELRTLDLNLPNLTTITGLNLTNLSTLKLEAPVAVADFRGCEKLLSCYIKSSNLISFDSSFMNPFYSDPILGFFIFLELSTPSLQTFIPPVSASLAFNSYFTFSEMCPYLSGSGKVNNFFNSLPQVNPPDLENEDEGSQLYLASEIYNQPAIDFTIAENKGWTVVSI